MPELPEVDWMVENLAPWTKAGEIYDIKIKRQNGRYFPTEAEQKDITGSVLLGCVRRGKYIIFKTDRGSIVCHNAMSGYWSTPTCHGIFDYVEGAREKTDKDIRFFFIVCSDLGSFHLSFHDSRLFGSARFYPKYFNLEKKLNLGPEALLTTHSDSAGWEWTAEDLVSSAKKSKKGKLPVKAFLMEQDVVAGIGNIYAAEALWRASVNPLRPANDLSEEELVKVYDQTRVVLSLAIFEKLAYSKYLRVYRQKKCIKCELPISVEKLAGRSTYFCKGCQK